MKKLKILIYSICIGAFFPVGSLYAQNVSIRAGIYDFTGMAASEIYRVAPTIQFGIPVWQRNKLCMEVIPGFSFKSKDYNENHHYLYMVPLLFSMNYTAANPDTKVFPVFSSGFTFLGKADHNVFMDKPIYSFTYGFHLGTGIRAICKNKSQLSLTLTYNLLIPPVMEKVNPSGVLIMIGYHFKVKSEQ
ncbi:MAG: hypothetical protein HY951_07255 [Bacteroidia bacterium]|nr:hypothetical protein [Bacteroidia bacterium]